MVDVVWRGCEGRLEGVDDELGVSVDFNHRRRMWTFDCAYFGRPDEVADVCTRGDINCLVEEEASDRAWEPSLVADWIRTRVVADEFETRALLLVKVAPLRHGVGRGMRRIRCIMRQAEAVTR